MGGISPKQRNTSVTGAGGGAGGGAGAMACSHKSRTGATAARAATTKHFIPHKQILSKYLASFLGTAELGVFSQLNRTCHTDVEHELAARKLLELTVKGKQKEVQSTLEANPKLLLIRTSTIDYSGKSIHDLTAFQAALCAGDANMVKMMQPYFDKLGDGSQKMAEQIHNVFPGGYDAHLHTQTETTFNFDTIFNAIAHAGDADVKAAIRLSGASYEQSDTARSKDDSDLTLIEALNRFRETFSQQSLSETIYNPQHLLKALALYNATVEPANRAIWNWDKRDLFWLQIIGFCQRFIPACTAQAFAQGLYYLVKAPEYQLRSWKAEHFDRSLKLRSGESFIYPITSSCSGLGFNFATGCGGHAYASSFVGVNPWSVAFSKNLFQSSQQVFAQLYQEASLRHGMHALNNAR